MKLKITLIALTCFNLMQSQTEFINTQFGADGAACVFMGPETYIMGDLIKVNDDYYGISSFSEYNLVKLSSSGSLYPSFGENGYVHLNFENNGGALLDYSNAFIRQMPNNNLLMAVDSPGMSVDNNYMVSTDLDGNIMQNFGNNGYVDLTWPNNIDLLSVDVTADEIVVIGVGFESLTPPNFQGYALVLKYDLDGNLITDFGNNGTQKYYIDINSALMNAVYIPSQSTIYMLIHKDILSFEQHSAILKYNIVTNAADTSYGSGGYANFYNNNGVLRPSALFADENNVVISGLITMPGGNDEQLFVKKLNTNGTLNTAFGINGTFTYDLPGTGYLQNSTINVSGNNITLSGYVEYADGSDKLFIVKSTGEGNVNNTFGNNGLVLSPDWGHVVVPYKLIEEEGLLTLATCSNICSQGNQSSPTVAQFLDSTAMDSKTQIQKDLFLYPNPVKDQLYFSNVQTIENGVIYDISGKQVCTVPTDATTANLSELKGGIYIFKAVINGESFTTKIIKE